MRIGYFTTDPVDFHLANQFGEILGATVVLLSIQDYWQTEEFKGLLYDPDFLPFNDWHQIRDQVLSVCVRLPVGIHSHRLSLNELKYFQLRGIVASYTLDAEIFHDLLKKGDDSNGEISFQQSFQVDVTNALTFDFLTKASQK